MIPGGWTGEYRSTETAGKNTGKQVTYKVILSKNLIE